MMRNMGLGSGMYNMPQQQQSPFALGSGLYGQPSTQGIANGPPMGGSTNFSGGLPMLAMGYGMLNGARKGQQGGMGMMDSLMQGLMMQRMMQGGLYGGYGGQNGFSTG